MNETEGKDYELLPEDTKEVSLVFKVIVIGDSFVGKSCLSYYASKKTFNMKTSPTVQVEFFSFCIKYKNQIVKLLIWDTAGMEQYRSLIKSFFSNSSMAVIVYAINNIEDWIRQLRTNSSPDCKVVLVGNKKDLENEREVQFQEGLNLKNKYSFDLFMETSAKLGFGVEELFSYCAKALYDNYESMHNLNDKDNDVDVIKELGCTLNGEIKVTKKGGRCCRK